MSSAENLLPLLIFISIAAISLNTPIIGSYLALINTLFHEFGHALVSLLTFGRIEKIELFRSTEGTAWTANRFWIGRVLTSAAGYPFASSISLLFLYLIKEGNYLYVFIILSFVVLFSLIFWIRNFYGFLWSISSLSLLYLLLIYGNQFFIETTLMLITSLILVESVKSAWTIMKLSFKTPLDAGDATNLWRSILFIPPQVWGVIFFLQSAIIAFIGVKNFIS